jgi:hypothetical protein
MRKIENQSGFTITELLVYMGILSIILVILLEIFVSVLSVKTESKSTSSVHQDGRFILSRLMYDINRAQSIKIPANLGEEADTLKVGVDGIDYTFFENGGSLWLENDMGVDQLNSVGTAVSDLGFRRLGNINGKNTVKVNFKLTSKVRRETGHEEEYFQTTIGLR